MRILLIEDDEVLQPILVDSLNHQHYAVDIAEDGEMGWEYAQSATYDLLLIDVGLPKLDGITLCQKLRTEGCTTPILLMTAKDASTERIRGLDAGADDYLTKPLDLAELQARVRALLRRGEVAASAVLEAEGLRLDPTSCQVTYHEQAINLTPKEYALLELLMRCPARVFSRGQLIEHLWTFDDPPQEESVKAHVKGLRQKLKAKGIADWVENVYGLGYRFNPKVSSAEKSGPVTLDLKTEPSSVEQQFTQKMEGLWQQYQGLMVERLAILQNAAILIQTSHLDPDTRQSATQAAHKLAGVLGMFQREEGTQMARAIEHLLEAAELAPAQQTKLVLMIQELSQQLDLPTLQPTASVSASLGPTVIDPQAVAIQSTDLSLQASQRANGDRVNSPATLGVRAATAGFAPSSTAGMRLLVVDDDPAFLAGLQLMLEPWGIAVTTLEDPLELWTVLPEVQPDLLVLDVEMPQQSGIDLCEAIRNHPDWQVLPILFLTAHREADLIQRMFAAGADDYVTKPIVGPELLTRITQRLERIRWLQTLSMRDPLTGLANQIQSSRVLNALLQQGEGLPVSLVVCAIHDLRSHNIRYGHPTVNRVLQRWGTTLRSALPEAAALGYWGNGEFVIGLPKTSQAEARDRIQPLLRILRQQIFADANGDRFQVESQWAIAEFPTDGLTLQLLYQAASLSLDQVHPN